MARAMQRRCQPADWRNIDAELMGRWVELLHDQTTVLEAHGAQVMAEIRTSLELLAERGPMPPLLDPDANAYLMADLVRDARQLNASIENLPRYSQLLASSLGQEQARW